MDNTSLLSKSTYSTVLDVPHEISIAAKLRRLKIEENILFQSLYKLDNDLNETHAHDSPYKEYRTFFINTRNSFAQIKKTFQDVKISVSSQEMLKSVEIDEIRGNILELENNIISFKTSLQTQLLALKSTACQLNSDLCEVPSIKIDKILKSTKLQITKYKEIVPSPVKILMDSPFKCVEVQEFQEFMKNSLNRYGGWNEYNHNIFVNSWQKLFYPENSDCWEDFERFYESSSTFQAFLEEVFPKLQGLATNEIISHAKWYLKYINHKERQQEAINKWRLNRDRMKKSTKVTKKSKKNVITKTSQKSNKRNNNIRLTDMDKLCENIDDVKNRVPSFNNHHRCLSEQSTQNKIPRNKISSNEESVEILHFLRPTKQWSNRCNNKTEEPYKYTNNLEYLKKLYEERLLGG